jgi:hypothetical protein
LEELAKVLEAANGSFRITVRDKNAPKDKERVVKGASITFKPGEGINILETPEGRMELKINHFGPLPADEDEEDDDD